MANTLGPSLRARELGQGVTFRRGGQVSGRVLDRQGGWSTGDKQDWVAQGQVRIEQKSHLNPEEKVSLWFYLLDQ